MHYIIHLEDLSIDQQLPITSATVFALNKLWALARLAVYPKKSRLGGWFQIETSVMKACGLTQINDEH